eukprot:SAG31_NODE_1105_length_9882_cov_5.270571_10_plen_198_part_00
MSELPAHTRWGKNSQRRAWIGGGGLAVALVLVLEIAPAALAPLAAAVPAAAAARVNASSWAGVCRLVITRHTSAALKTLTTCVFPNSKPGHQIIYISSIRNHRGVGVPVLEFGTSHLDLLLVQVSQEPLANLTARIIDIQVRHGAVCRPCCCGRLPEPLRADASSVLKGAAWGACLGWSSCDAREQRHRAAKARWAS